MYHFDKGIERKNTNCEKWDADFVGDNVLPMCVADMDFEIAPAITKRLVKAAQKGAFGYQLLSDDYYQTFIDFMKERHDYSVEKEWICYVPNVCLGLFLAVQTISNLGDEIIIQVPVYGPFFKVVEESGRKLVENRLINKNGQYTMDYDDLEAKITEKTKALILCNPHNPTGRVWTKDELEKLVNICAKHDICIISDDIHSDIISKDHKHTMVTTICQEHGVKCISCTSPSKPFNLASLHVANCIIEDKEIREKFQYLIRANHVGECNAFAEEALVGAYKESLDWLDEMNAYVEENIDYFVKEIEENMPTLKVRKPEGTYLVWVDFTETDVEPEELHEYLQKECGVLAEEGEFFGKYGKGYARFNMACPRGNVEEALRRMKNRF